MLPDSPRLEPYYIMRIDAEDMAAWAQAITTAQAAFGLLLPNGDPQQLCPVEHSDEWALLKTQALAIATQQIHEANIYWKRFEDPDQARQAFIQNVYAHIAYQFFPKYPAEIYQRFAEFSGRLILEDTRPHCPQCFQRLSSATNIEGALKTLICPNKHIVIVMQSLVEQPKANAQPPST